MLKEWLIRAIREENGKALKQEMLLAHIHPSETSKRSTIRIQWIEHRIRKDVFEEVLRKLS